MRTVVEPGVNRVRLDSDGTDVKASVATGSNRLMPVGTILEDDLVESLQKLSARSTGLLPASILWVSPTGRQIIMQRPPRRVWVEYTQGTVGQIRAKEQGDEEVANLKKLSLHMPLPWTVYGLTFDLEYRLREAKIYSAYGPIEGPGNVLGYLPLPNIHGDCRFCLPEYWEENGGAIKDDPSRLPAPNLASGIMNAYQQIWSSNFNLDLMDLPSSALQSGYPAIIAKPPPSRITKAAVSVMLTRWSELSLQEVAKIPEWHHATSVGSVIQALQQANNQMYNSYWLTSMINTSVQQARQARNGAA